MPRVPRHLEEIDPKRAMRIAAVLAGGALLAGAASWATRSDDRPRGASTVASAAPDPLRAELVRCQTLGQAALDDDACRAAWAENRRRFFGAPHEGRRR